MHTSERFLVRVLGKNRECFITGEEYVHATDPTWRVLITDRAIEKVTPMGPVVTDINPRCKKP